MLADLHHAMSVRSFRTTDSAAFVKAVLDVNTNTAKEPYARIKSEERKLYLKNTYCHFFAWPIKPIDSCFYVCLLSARLAILIPVFLAYLSV